VRIAKAPKRSVWIVKRVQEGVQVFYSLVVLIGGSDYIKKDLLKLFSLDIIILGESGSLAIVVH
jgi:hypothetical protein